MLFKSKKKTVAQIESLPKNALALIAGGLEAAGSVHPGDKIPIVKGSAVTSTEGTEGTPIGGIIVKGG